LTIFDMLELLETEVVSLRAQNLELRLAIDRQSVNGGTRKGGKRASATKKKAKRKTAGTSRKTKAAGAGTVNGTGEQMDAPAHANPGDPQPEAHPLGKRKALGKSLLQLRKVAAPRQL
jgi:hypothetical protein